MCGLVAYLRGKKSVTLSDYRDVFTQMLYADTFRGFDSTGVFLGDGNTFAHEQTLSFKKALAAPDFLQTKMAERMIKAMMDYDIAVGHNRAATRGGVLDSTAHPFNFEYVVGVHNGTLNTYAHLNKEEKFTVDSEALFSAINREGFENISDQINGAFALIWYDKFEDNLKVARNDDRPLYMLKIKNHDDVIICSESKMGEWILGRNAFGVESVMPFESGHLYTFHPGFPTEFEKKKVKLYTPPVTTYYSGKKATPVQTHKGGTQQQKESKTETFEAISVGKEASMYVNEIKETSTNFFHISGYIDAGSYPSANVYVARGTAPFNIEDIDIGDVVNGVVTTIRPLGDTGMNITMNAIGSRKDMEVILFKGPKGNMVEQAEWDELTKHGCAQCQDNLIESGDVAFWTHSNQPICINCEDDFHNHGGYN